MPRFRAPGLTLNRFSDRVHGLSGFKKGLNPERRSEAYLKEGQIFLRPQVEILTVSIPPLAEPVYKRRDKLEDKVLSQMAPPGGRFPDTSEVRKFVYWHWAQLQFQNPNVQLLQHHHMFPNAFFRAFLEDGRDVVIDLEGKSRSEIHAQLEATLGKTEWLAKAEAMEETKKHNPAGFGTNFERHCICEVPGQFPCPALLPTPKFLLGEWRYNHNLV